MNLDILVRKIFHKNETGVQFEDDKGENYIWIKVGELYLFVFFFFLVFFFNIENNIFLSYCSNYSSDYHCYWLKGNWVSSYNEHSNQMADILIQLLSFSFTCLCVLWSKYFNLITKLGMPMKHTGKLAGSLNRDNLSFFRNILVAFKLFPLLHLRISCTLCHLQRSP